MTRATFGPKDLPPMTVLGRAGVTDAAARVLAAAGIDPAAVEGTGSEGTVTKADAEKAVREKEG